MGQGLFLLFVFVASHATMAVPFYIVHTYCSYLLTYSGGHFSYTEESCVISVALASIS